MHRSVESPGQKQETGLTPHIGFFNSLQREVYYYADEKIVIEEGLDSFAGMIWPAVSSCRGLTHDPRVAVWSNLKSYFLLSDEST